MYTLIHVSSDNKKTFSVMVESELLILLKEKKFGEEKILECIQNTVNQTLSASKEMLSAKKQISLQFSCSGFSMPCIMEHKSLGHVAGLSLRMDKSTDHTAMPS